MSQYLIYFVFCFFAAVLLGSAVCVVRLQSPVHAALCLVLAFFASAVLWLLAQAEFLALVLVFVYVGAVMTLFLFVLMMFSLKRTPHQRAKPAYLGLGAACVLVLCTLSVFMIDTGFNQSASLAALYAKDYSNTQALGLLLYTHYAYPFEIAAVLLLATIVAAIALVLRGKQQRKSQDIAKQLMAHKADRLKLVK